MLGGERSQGIGWHSSDTEGIWNFLKSHVMLEQNHLWKGKPQSRDIKQVTTDATEDSYCVNMFFSYLDHIVQHLSSSFPPELKAAMYGCYLIPSYQDKLNIDKISAIHEE